jgi:hypothetical protein
VETTETGPLGNLGEHRVRLTEREAQLNMRTVLRLCAAGKLRCGEKTMRPSSATISIVASHLAGATSIFLTRSRHSRGHCWSRPAAWPDSKAEGSS